MAIANRLRDRRLELGLTQTELADIAGTTQQSIQSIESGNIRRPRNLIEIAKALGVSPEWLAQEDPQETLRSIGEVIAELMEENDISEIKLAELTNSHVVNIRNLLKRKSPSARKRTIERFSEAFGITTNEMLNRMRIKPDEEKEKPSSGTMATSLQSDSSDFNKYPERDAIPQSASTVDSWDDNTPLDPDDVEVPYMTGVSLSAGQGILSYAEDHGGRLRFSRHTLRKQGIQAANVVCVRVDGESMDPVLPDGATVGIDTANTEIRDGKIYAINHDGLLRVKVLQKLPGDGLRLRSYNMDKATFPDEDYYRTELDNIRVLGRIFWYSVIL
ncbi:helix-turn-helix transcriptional regulator [Ferrimonas balearica]|uniref:LexA family transcriptional regulator n=1 Tax=Ferrimonas balearica TaxID=44012 RepID=UPI001C946D14|nr:helix-turn-helix transcriptional regulator [Ferrimonas balearica]MBY6104880.1 helix-turn-helix transcriptional regulator [Ferrimonas balearica]